jgi:Holliday junction resolvasome RuvABC DNA-binding subunit
MISFAAPAVDRMNAQVADRLEEAAQLLEQQKANPFRVQAYRNAASTVRGLPRSVLAILHEEGLEGLDRLPSIGPALARAIEQVVMRGRLPMLERLRGESDPVALLSSVPGVGRRLAERLHEELDIETLEQLEAAAHDGTLKRVQGFGEKRVAGIRDALATRLSRRRLMRLRTAKDAGPPVDEILDVDREYREASAAGRLPTIAPRRFNPGRESWLPVMHTWRGSRHYTVLFSNTARAHQLGKTHDWVVLYFDGRDGEQQHTVVTAMTGPLKGRRVVRGRETECEQFYARPPDARRAARR